MNDADEWMCLVSKAESYPEGSTTSPVIESNVGVKRSLNLPSADYDGYRRMRKLKTTSTMDSLLDAGVGYSGSRRSRQTTPSSSRRPSIDASSSIYSRNFARASRPAPDLSFIQAAHSLMTHRDQDNAHSTIAHANQSSLARPANHVDSYPEEQGTC